MKNTKKHRRKNAYKRFSWVFCIFLVLALTLFSISFVSAFKFDDFKTYDDVKKEYVLTNALGLGEEIARIRLDTPTDIIIGLGYQKVAEMTFTNGENDYNIINGIELYNIKDDMKEIIQKIDYKYKAIKNIDLYKTECSVNGNISTCKDVYWKTEQKDEWLDFTENTLLKNEVITIGLFTNVKQGDYVEWIINVYGNERLTKWTTWSGNIETNLFLYYEMDESAGATGTIVDSMNSNDGTNDGADETGGKLHKGYDFVYENSDKITSDGNTGINAAESHSMCAWVKRSAAAGGGQPAPIMMLGTWGGVDDLIYLGFGTSANDLRITTYGGGGCEDASIPTGESLVGNWHYVCQTYDGTNCRTYINGRNIQNNTATFTLDDDVFRLGFNTAAGQELNSTLDEVGLWTRTITLEEIRFLYNSGNACAFGEDDCIYKYSPIVTLNSPVDNYNSTSSSITFNCTASDDLNLVNVSLYLDGVLNQTNSSGLNNTNYIFTKTYAEGYYNWSCSATDNQSKTTTATYRHFNYSDDDPLVTLNSPVDNYNSTSQTITFNCTASDDINLVNVSLYLDGVLNVTNTTGLNNSNNVWTETIGEGNHNWSCKAFDSHDQSTITSRDFNVDTIFPVINILYPANAINYYDGYVSSTIKSIDLNWTTTDTNLDICWYYNSTDNVTITCNDNATINLTYETYTFKFYANDTFGHETNDEVTATWNYGVLENSLSYNSTTVMGSSETFIANVSYDDDDFTNSIGYLVYNETSYTSARTGSDGTYIFTKSINVPEVSAETNLTFYWSFIINNGTDNTYNSSSYNQTISTLIADNCSVYNYTLYNFTIVDEKTQVRLNGATQNTTAKLTLKIYTLDGTTLIQNLSTTFNETNSFAICLNENLSNGASYEIDLELEYDADDYAHEFYNIQDEILTSSDIPTNITLYDLDDTSAQEFKITYKNENFLAVADALIQIQRKYIGEGLFKTIEIPKTDSNGETIAHLELSDVIYTIIVVKAGSTLATFNNIIAYCDNVATGDCEINLNAFASTIAVEDFATSDDFSYTFDWDDSTKTITVVYTIPSGTTSTVKLNTTLYDQLGDTEVCSDVLTSASGTLICVVPTSFGNSTVLAKLTKAGDFMGQAMIGINQEPSEIYGSNIVFLSLFLMITIVGLGISSNPMITGFFLLLGGILSVALNFVDTVGYFGAGATILWLFIAIIIILIKGSKRQ